MRRSFLVLLALAGLQAGSLHAQRLAGNPFLTADGPAPAADPSINPFPRREVDPVFLAAGGLAAGAVGGALAGSYVTRHDCEDCALVGAVYGAVAGGSALLPLGVHLTNRQRGNFGLSLLSSLVIGAAGLGVATAANSVEVMLAVPVLQIVSSVLIERRTEKGG